MHKDKIKIFVDCHVFDKGYEGTRTYIHGLYKELIKRADIKFFLASYNIEDLKKCFGQYENVIYVKYNSKSAFYRLIFDIPKIIKMNKIDFAHFQYRIPPIKHCKYMVTTHDVLFEDFPEDFPRFNRYESHITYKYSTKKADINFTVSNYSKAQIQKHYKVDNPVVTPNGVDKVFFENYDKDEIQRKLKDKLDISNYIIYVSRFEPRKNQHLLLKYFVEEKLYLTKELVFIGSITFQYKEFDELYKNLNDTIKAKIKIFQKIEFSLLTQIIKGADASVYASKAEGFGIPPLESIAAQVPTICSNQTAMKDYSFFEEYLFNPNNEIDFKRALHLVTELEDKKLNVKQLIVKENYNWNKTAKILLESIENY